MLYACFYMLLFVKTCEYFCLNQFLFWLLGISLCITLAFCSFLSISIFISGTCFSIMFYEMPIDIFQWRRQTGNFNKRSCFSRCTIFLDFSIMSLFKLLIKLLCCIMLKVSILLQCIYTVITFCKSVICIYNSHILYLSLLANYLCQVWLSKLHINLSGDIKLNPGPKSNSCETFSICH